MSIPFTSRADAPTPSPRPAGVSVHIERLVLNGLPAGRDAGTHLQAAFTSELTRLLTDAAVRGDWRAGAAISDMRLAPLVLDEAMHPSRIGQLLAQALANNLMSSRSSDEARHG